MSARNYSSVARISTLTTSVTNSATTMAVDNTTGYPTPPFTIVVDPGRNAEEICTVTGVVGLSYTVLRGQDGSPSQPHDAGAQIRHMATARDFADAAQHIDAVAGVHGVSGFLIGSVDVGVLDNKTFSPTGGDHVPIILQQVTGQASHLLDMRNASGTTLAYLSNVGRVNTPGVDGTNQSTFQAGSSSSPSVIVQGAASHSGSILSIRDSVGNEVFGIGANGIATGTLSTPQLTATAGSASSVPLVAKGAASQSANIFEVRDSTSTAIASVSPTGALTAKAFTIVGSSMTSGMTSTGQMYNGSQTAGLLPFRIHAGVDVLTMLDGATSQQGTVDLTPYGFTVAPIITATAGQGDINTIKRRVAVNIIYPPTATSFSYRVIQTSNEPIVVDTTYRVYWIAMQATPGVAQG
jgi:hypothetical protein